MNRNRGSIVIAAGITFLWTVVMMAAPLPREYRDLQASNTVVAPGLDTIRSSEPLQLKPGVEQRLRLSTEDPVTRIGTELTHFRTVEVDATPGSDSRVTVTSRCNCYGFRERIVDPAFVILDSSGNKLAEKINGAREIRPKHRNTVQLQTTATVRTPDDGKLFVVIAADNQKSGSIVAAYEESVERGVVGESQVGMSHGDTYFVGVESSPVGTISVRVDRAESR